ncbi:MAG: hypothetical protein AB7D00_12830 [Rhodospirillaceae bacterium]
MTEQPAESLAETRTWPQGLAQIARIIGPRKAIVLAEALGGVETYIPKAPGSDHPLARLVGHEAALALAAVYGGLTVVIPRGVYRNLKKAAIMDAPPGSRRQTALALGVTQRYVRKVANAAKAAEEGTLPDLFKAVSKAE